MSQNPSRSVGLLPPPPLLTTEMLPMPTHFTPTSSSSLSFAPPLPPPPIQQPLYQYQQQPGFINPYHQSIQGAVPQQPAYQPAPGTAQYQPAPGTAQYQPAPQYQAPVHQAPVHQGAMNQALIAAASQMMFGNMMGQISTKRHKRRSSSPKVRRTRSRSESPPERYRRQGKRRRNKSPGSYKTARHRIPSKEDKNNKDEKGASKLEEEEKSDVVKAELNNSSEIKEEVNNVTIYRPPTPLVVEEENENGSKTPDYQNDAGTPTTPEYDVICPAVTAPPEEPPSNTNTSPILKTKVALTKTIVSLKDVRGNKKSAPGMGVKSLAEILREQALQSMKRKPTPERDEKSRDSTSRESMSRDATPELKSEPDRFRTRAESPVLDRSTTDTAKLVHPFDNVDRNAFRPEESFDKIINDFYSDDEFDPAKYHATLSDDDLLNSPTRDIPKINVNFTVKKTKEMKEERRLAKLEKKRHKEMRKQQKLAKKSKKRAKNDERTTTEFFSSSSPSTANTTDDVTPPGTPEQQDVEHLSTPEKCDDIFFEDDLPLMQQNETKPKKKGKRKIILKKDSQVPTFAEKPPPKAILLPPRAPVPKRSISPPSAAGNVFSAALKTLVPKEQYNTVSTSNNRQAKEFNPFAASQTSQTALPPPITYSSLPSTSLPTNSYSSLPSTSLPTNTYSLKSQQPRNPTVLAAVRVSKPPQKVSKPTVKVGTIKKKSGVKTIKIKKVQSETNVIPSNFLHKPQLSSKAKDTSNKDEDLDDFEKELELLNAALDAAPVTPTETTTRTPKEDDILFDDEDMFADIEEILNEERRNL